MIEKFTAADARRLAGPSIDDHIAALASREASPAALTDDEDAANEWRRLALQFDGHRMQAMGLIRLCIDKIAPNGLYDFLRKRLVEFNAAPPLPGEQILADRIAALASPQVAPAPDKQRIIALDQIDAESKTRYGGKKNEWSTRSAFAVGACWMQVELEKLAAPVQVAPAKVYLVATGEVVDGLETYTRHEGAPPPLCDSEVLFATPMQPGAAADDARDAADPLTDEREKADREVWYWMGETETVLGNAARASLVNLIVLARTAALALPKVDSETAIWVKFEDGQLIGWDDVIPDGEYFLDRISTPATNPAKEQS